MKKVLLLFDKVANCNHFTWKATNRESLSGFNYNTPSEASQDEGRKATTGG